MFPKTLLSFAITIREIKPLMPLENMPLEVVFDLHNRSGRDVAGVVVATVADSSGAILTSASTAQIDLANGASLTSTIVLTSPAAGIGRILALSYEQAGAAPTDESGGKGGALRFTSVDAVLDVAARYFFSFDRFLALQTRARKNDTNTVFVELRVGGQEVRRKIKEMGDIQAGQEGVANLVLGPIDLVPDGTPVGFKYSVINLGFGGSSQGEARIAFDTISDFAEAVASGLLGFGPFWEQVNRFMHLLHSLFYANCDGTVAVDFFPFTGASLEELTRDRDVITTTAVYPPGQEQENKLTFTERSAVMAMYKSPDGCGDDSLYHVSWTLSRDRNTIIL